MRISISLALCTRAWSRIPLLGVAAMEIWMQTGIGILVSVGLFLFTYRQTWGANRERARAATDELASGLARLLIGEGAIPAADDLRAMLEAQARRHRVSPGFMPTTDQLRGVLLTRLVLLEYVPNANRSELIAALVQTPRDVLESATGTEVSRGASWRDRSFALMTGFVSVTGGLVTVMIASVASQTAPAAFEAILLSLLASMVAVVVVSLLIGFRSGDVRFESIHGYERQSDHALRDLLDRYELKYRVGGPNDGYDYKIWVDGQLTLVELKSGRTKRSTALRLAAAMKEEGATKAILVVNSRKGAPAVTGVDAMTFKEFLGFLKPQESEAA